MSPLTAAAPTEREGLSRRKQPASSSSSSHINHGGSRGKVFPHGGLPLMIVANKVDKVSVRDLRSLRATCDNHILTSAKHESYLDEMPFVDFFYEIKEVYART
jgi:hypothetical protein